MKTTSESHIPFLLLKNYAKQEVSAREAAEINEHCKSCGHCAQVLSDIQFYLEKHRHSSDALERFVQTNASQQKFEQLIERKKRQNYIRPLQAAAVVLLAAPAIWLWQQYGDVSNQLNNAPLAIQIDTVGRGAARYQMPDYTHTEPLLADNNEPSTQEKKNTPNNKNTQISNKIQTNKNFLDGAIAANFSANEAFEEQMNLNVRSENTGQVLAEPFSEQVITDTLQIVWADGYQPSEEYLLNVFDNKGKEVMSFTASEENTKVSLKNTIKQKGLYYLVVYDNRESIIHHSKFFYGQKE